LRIDLVGNVSGAEKQLRDIEMRAQQEAGICLWRRKGSKMSEDDNSRDKPTNGRRGRRSKGRASSTVARPKAPQRPRVASRAVRKAAVEQPQPPQPAEEAGGGAAVEAQKADEQVAAPGPEGAGASVGGGGNVPGDPEARLPAKRIPKRRSPVSKTSAAKPQASPEADTPPRRGKAAGPRAGDRQRAGGSEKRVDTGGSATASVGPEHPTSPERIDLPAVDPMADLVGLAEGSLRESLQSLRSVSESRTLPELIERQSRHMRLMTEIWMRQAQRSMEVFNAMLSQGRK
jgi:hypothetical protein